MFFFFFFNDTATTEIYTLSLHDALPIYTIESYVRVRCNNHSSANVNNDRTASECSARTKTRTKDRGARSEEHTSELQSQSNLVCRLLLEKKKTRQRLITCAWI